MARSIRIQSAGAFYHVMARGHLREKIFQDDDDRRFFLHTLAQACEMTGWRVHAWVLLRDHYHLFLQTPEPNLVAGMAWLQNSLTRRYNVLHSSHGRLFGDRYKSVIVEGTDRHYYKALLDYIHLNPVRARLVRPEKGGSVLDYPWSSLAGGYALPQKKRAPWLAVAAGLKACDLPDSNTGRRQMVKHLDRRAKDEKTKMCGVPPLPDEMDARTSHLRRGWYLGSPAFGDAMRHVAASKDAARPRSHRRPGQAADHGQRQAEIWLARGLKAAGLGSAELRRAPGSDPRKVLLAELLWRRTVVSQPWLAEKLGMKSAANVSQQIRRLDSKQALKQVPKPLRDFVKETDASGS